MADAFLWWLKRAERDLKSANFNLEGGEFEVAAFLCQQAAEKALKAIYIKEFKELWKIHDLVELARKVRAPESVLESCDSLNRHYIETRYPIEAEYDEKTAVKALKNAKEVVSWSRKKLD